MSSSETWATGKQVALKLRAADPFTEIRVLNARFEPVALTANTGNIVVNVPPGLYEVGFRLGKGWESQHVFATPEVSEVIVAQPAPPSDGLEAMRSAAPVVEPRPQPKPGATVVVSVTGTTSGSTDEATAPKVVVTLSSGYADDEIVADLVPGEWRSFQFAVAPGHWRLRLSEPGERPPFELPLTVSPGYRLEVIAPLCPTGEMSVDLERLRVRLLPSGMPDMMDATLVGFEDAALAALSSGRPLYGRDFEDLIENLIDDKARNPMLGIFAAHLCERGKDDDLSFQERLLDKLGALTGSPAIVNPDVAALRLRFLMRTERSIDNEPAVAFPPLLAASWGVLLDAARLRPELIPAGSLSERVAARLWSSSLWVAWSAAPLAAPLQARLGRRSAAAETKVAAHDFATVSATIASGLADPKLRDWFRGARSSSSSSAEGLGGDDTLDLTPAEVAVARVLYPVAADEARQDRFAQLAQKVQGSGSPIGSDLTVMSKVLGLPPTTVEQAVGSLAGKLGSRAAGFNIKFGE